MEATELLAGMLRRTLFVIYSGPVAGVEPERGAAHFAEHLRHLMNWEQQGILFAAGPFLENGKATARAMYILRAGSLDEARSIASDEPLHRHGIREFTVDEWVLNQGRVSLTIDFSTQRGGLDGPPPSLHPNKNRQGAQ
ncbi:uncharacterized protein YciI [Arthrobacter ginsengisoli]|uniref:Uncharacterized protein YciI n=1 Tax=Arthrobacter ginsengisoli TaxID=1356565 RepID=A0ABU1UDN7_9MICC|nr:YciI family protein [Arthrobacter ginsengisoli]MDR7083258.1 uncharacterized protein YciI [Arthrobacter ginsengisoli]